MKKCFLGIDGGATKSTLVLIDLKGKKIFETTGKSLNYRNLDKEKFIQNLNELIIKAKKKGKILFSCLSLAGIDTETDKKRVTNIIEKSKVNKILKSNFIVKNDIEVLFLTVNVEDGVAVIAGTGSNFFAKNKNKIARAGGLDYILSDEGSAFDIGQKVLRASVRSKDGRGEKTILEKMVLKKAGIKNIRDLVNLIYGENLKQKVGEFAPLAEIALKKKDKVAKKILLSAIDELENGIITVTRKAKLKGEFKICLVGSVFKNKYILNKLEIKLKKRFKKAKIIIVKNPAIGAAKFAKKEFEKLSVAKFQS